jgi:hypothetical protein
VSPIGTPLLMSHVHAYKWKLKAHKTHDNFEKKREVSMNKITPHLLRDLDATLPAGTEYYLCAAARKALRSEDLITSSFRLVF